MKSIMTFIFDSVRSSTALAAVVTAGGDALSVSSGSAVDFAKNLHQVSGHDIFFLFIFMSYQTNQTLKICSL